MSDRDHEDPADPATLDAEAEAECDFDAEADDIEWAPPPDRATLDRLAAELGIPSAEQVIAELGAYLDAPPPRRKAKVAPPRRADLDLNASPTGGLTPSELGRFLRVSPDKVRAWIACGELGALNTGTHCRPRFIVLPEHLAAFVKARRAASAPEPTWRRKMTYKVDYFPD